MYHSHALIQSMLLLLPLIDGAVSLAKCMHDKKMNRRMYSVQGRSCQGRFAAVNNASNHASWRISFAEIDPSLMEI
jgi:hypothetical protein